MEGIVAEEAKAAAAAPAGGGGGKQSLLLIVLAVVNMIAVGAVGFMLYSSRQKEAKENTIEQVVQGEAEAQHEDHAKEALPKAPVVPLETFIVNLAGSKGRRILRLDLELEVSDSKVVAEIDLRKAQIRDIIIIMLSGRTYDQIAAKDGKNELREDFKGTLNAFLTKGKVTNVYFTNLLYN